MYKEFYTILPVEFIRQAIETYTKNNGKAPKVLCVSNEDYADWVLTGTIHGLNQFDLKVVTGDYLKTGEMDLAMGVKDDQ